MQSMANFKPAKIQRVNAEPLSSALSSFITVNGLAEGLFRQKVFSCWEELAGTAGYESGKYLKDGVLYVTFKSSVVRSSLSFRLPEILEGVNDMLGRDETLMMAGIRDRLNAIRLR